ncbi:MAG TPA: tetratricopeptide repeat protein [Planctomycetota bacterium]|nr:tetratricopeptide repeat protein [Planctomycetota bacterium]
MVAAAGSAQAQDDAFRAPCDQAAANSAAGKNKEVVAALEPLFRDAALGKSPNHDRLCYYLGCAAFALDGDLIAGRALSRLAPFEASPYAPHARYLLGRLHHRGGEYSEAAVHYDAVPAAYEKQLAAAKQALGNAAALKDKPAEKAFLESYVKGPAPDYVAESIFHSGVLLYELKNYTEALARFVAFSQKDKRPAWQEENRLRMGMCQVRLGQGPEALKTLQPIQDHPKLARAARWWMAKAILSIPEGKPADAAEHLKKASGAPELETGPATAEILLALGDALERAGKGAEAVGVYQQVVSQNVRAEEGLARLVGAHAAAKQYREADAAADKFEKSYPGSPLLGDVLLRRADSGFAEAQAANKPELFDESIKRYGRVLQSASGPAANAARYRLALAQYRQGKTEAALENLRAIPEAERAGELLAASYLQADCLLRTTQPSEDAMDAVAAEAVLENLQEAMGLLQKFLPAAGPQTPEVMLKLAHARRQTAVLLVEPGERTAVANSARELYEAFRNQFANHPLRPLAEYERANCFAIIGDNNTAIQKLERFKAEPLASASVAPLALLRQAQLYRSIGQPQPAAQILADCRAKYEAALLKDPARASWVPLLRYHHAAALKEIKQMAEAAQILESVVKEYGASEWGDPARRLLKEVKP